MCHGILRELRYTCIQNMPKDIQKTSRIYFIHYLAIQMELYLFFEL